MGWEQRRIRGMGWMGGVGGLRTPWWCCAREYVQYPASAPSTSEVAVGLCPFCIPLFIIAQLFLCAVTISPLHLLCILLAEQMFVQVQAQGSQVLACLVCFRLFNLLSLIFYSLLFARTSYLLSQYESKKDVSEWNWVLDWHFRVQMCWT